MGVQLENAKLKPLCFDLRWEILYLFVVVICRFLSTSQFYNFYDTKIRITPLSRPCFVHLAQRESLSYADSGTESTFPYFSKSGSTSVSML